MDSTAIIACCALSVVLFFAAAIMSAVSTSRSWIEYTVPDSVRFNINRRGYEQLTELYREYPQMFYSRHRYLNSSYEMCFDEMSTESWRDVFRKDVPKVQRVYTDDDTIRPQDAFCLTRQESNSRFIHPTSNNSNSSFQLQGQQLDKIQSDTVPAIRKVLETEFVLLIVVWHILLIVVLPCCFKYPGWALCIAFIMLATTEALCISAVSMFYRLVAEEDDVTVPPYYGFVRNHEILRQTTRSTRGFDLVCASIALIGVGMLLLLLLVPSIIHVSRHGVQCCETRTVRAWRERRAAKAIRRLQTRMTAGDGRSSAGTHNPVRLVSVRWGIQDSKDADEILTVSATVAEPPIVTFHYLPDMLIAK